MPAVYGNNRLSKQERRVLAVLYRRYPNYVPYHEFYQHVWPGKNMRESPGALRTLIHRLRNKVGQEAVISVIGSGVVINPSNMPSWAEDLAKLELSTAMSPTPDLQSERAPIVKKPVDPAMFVAVDGARCYCKQCECSCCEQIKQMVRVARQTRDRRWTELEDRYLEQTWKETYWLPDVVEAVNEVALRPRTMSAVRDRLTYHGYSLLDGNFSVSDVTVELGVNEAQVRLWISRGDLKARRRWDSRWWVIRKNDLIEFINRPDILLPSSRMRNSEFRNIRQVRETEWRKAAGQDRTGEEVSDPDRHSDTAILESVPTQAQ
jgi:hypothetical protein